MNKSGDNDLSSFGKLGTFRKRKRAIAPVSGEHVNFKDAAGICKDRCKWPSVVSAYSAYRTGKRYMCMDICIFKLYLYVLQILLLTEF